MVLRFIEEFSYDMDFNEPKIIIKDELCVVENVDSIVMIGENSLTLGTQTKYITLNYEDYLIKEIIDGRVLVEGKIQSVEILYASSKDNNRRIQNKQIAKHSKE